MSVSINNRKRLEEEGLESSARFYSVYEGKAEDNQDPQNLGRLKVSCAKLYGDNIPNIWVRGRGNVAGAGHGIYWIPQPGDPVYISCVNGDPRFPLWEPGWWLRGQTPTGVNPDIRTLISPSGHRVELNDQTDVVTVRSANGFEIQLRNGGIFLGQNATFNLGQWLRDLMQLLETTTSGGMPFDNIAQFVALRLELNNWLDAS